MKAPKNNPGGGKGGSNEWHCRAFYLRSAQRDTAHGNECFFGRSSPEVGEVVFWRNRLAVIITSARPFLDLCVH